MTAEEAQPASGMPLSSEEKKLVVGLVAGGLTIQNKFCPEPLHKQTGKGHFDNDTVGEIRRVKEQQPNGVNHERE
jgi:hypothetical protein